MTAGRTTLAAVLAALALAGAPGAASAQSSKADAFAGKIPPVSGQLYQKAGRVELTATGNLSLNDAFYAKYFGGLKATYHFTDHWAAGVQAAGGTAVPTNSAVVCSSSSGCTDATSTMLRQVPGRIRYIVGAEGAWAPIYGKLNVVSEQVAHFDLSILAGPDLIGYDEVLAKEVAATQTPAVLTAFGGHVGLGLRVFFTPAVAARIEIKDYLYSVNVPNGGIGKDLQSQLFAELGVSWFLGASRPTR